MHRMPYTGTIPDVLVVDDNQADLQLLGEAFAECGIPAHLHHASTGEQAWERLERRGRSELLPEPDLVILDLNMPLLDGRALLQRLAQHPRWHHLPVVVLTSSQRTDDLDNCARMGAISYYIKPHTWDEYLGLARSLKEFWVVKH